MTPVCRVASGSAQGHVLPGAGEQTPQFMTDPLFQSHQGDLSCSGEGEITTRDNTAFQTPVNRWTNFDRGAKPDRARMDILGEHLDQKW